MHSWNLAWNGKWTCWKWTFAHFLANLYRCQQDITESAIKSNSFLAISWRILNMKMEIYIFYLLFIPTDKMNNMILIIQGINLWACVFSYSCVTISAFVRLMMSYANFSHYHKEKARKEIPSILKRVLTAVGLQKTIFMKNCSRE